MPVIWKDWPVPKKKEEEKEVWETWPEPEEEIPTSEALGTGFASGFTGGWYDEMMAGGKRAADVLAGEEEDLYEEYRKEARGRAKKVKEDSPFLYSTAEMAGSLISPINKITGPVGKVFGGGLKAGGKELLKRVFGGAVEGGVAAAGLSEAEKPEHLIEDIKSGAKWGGGISGGMPLISKGAQKTGDAIKWAGKKVAPIATLVPEKAMSRYTKRPEAVRGAKEAVELAEEMGDDLHKLQASAIDESHKIMDELIADNVQVDTAGVKQFIKDQMEGLNIGDVPISKDMPVLKGLQEMMTRIDKFGDQAPAAVVKKLIKRIDAHTKYAKGDISISDPATNAMLKNVRHSLNQALGDSHKGYREAMASVNKKMKLLEVAEKKFGDVDKRTAKFEKYTKQSFKKKRPLTPIETKTIKDLSEYTGKDYFELLDDRALKDLFEEGSPSALRTGLYTILGTMIGAAAGLGHAVIGAGVGKAVGTSVGRHAPKVSQWIVDRYMAGRDNPVIRGYMNALKKAAERGNESLMLTHQILVQKEPEYKEWIEGKGGPLDAERKYNQDSIGSE